GSPEHGDVAAELLDDVCDHPVVGGGRGAQDGRRLRELADYAGDAPVVRTEVVPPVADAVRLVDDQQAGGLQHVGEDVRAELVVVEALGRDEQDVDGVVGDLLGDGVPVVAVRRVDGGGPNTDPPGHVDLVPHEGQQRRDEQCRPAAVLAQQ